MNTHSLSLSLSPICILHEQERDKLKAAVKSPDSWPLSKDKLGIKYHKIFKDFMDNILLNKEQ